MSRQEERDASAEMWRVQRDIELIAQSCTTHYDHRKDIPESILHRFPHLMDDCQLKCARLKFAVAACLMPTTILEIGVGWGMSARAFVAGLLSVRGVGNIKYIGYDNGAMGVSLTEALSGLPVQASAVVIDTNELESFSEQSIDLIHIDGGHDPDTKAADVRKAVTCGARWIICDDAHDPMVAAGIFAGLRDVWKGTIPMAYFPDSHTGSLLIKNVMPERKDW